MTHAMPCALVRQGCSLTHMSQRGGPRRLGGPCSHHPFSSKQRSASGTPNALHDARIVATHTGTASSGLHDARTDAMRTASARAQPALHVDACMPASCTKGCSHYQVSSKEQLQSAHQTGCMMHAQMPCALAQQGCSLPCILMPACTPGTLSQLRCAGRPRSGERGCALLHQCRTTCRWAQARGPDLQHACLPGN